MIKIYRLFVCILYIHFFFNIILNSLPTHVNINRWTKNINSTENGGVEDETLSCGTGVTAAAMAYAIKHDLSGDVNVPIETKGGSLRVLFHRDNNSFTNVYLIGPAVKVFEGTINIEE